MNGQIWRETNRPALMNVTSATQHEQIGPSRGLVGAYGFVPNLFALQKQLPRVIEGEQHLIDAILLPEDRLSRRLKDSLLLTVATGAGLSSSHALECAVADLSISYLRTPPGPMLQRAVEVRGKLLRRLRDHDFRPHF